MYNYSPNTDINETIQFALKLGLAPLPVVPEQDANKYPQIDKKTGQIKRDKNGKPLPRFTGKNPSYFDEKGEPRIIYHSNYHDKLPTDEELILWFLNPATNGIGVLGNHNIRLIDPDVKDFESPEHCEEVVEEWLDRHPLLKGTWIERTRRDGYRIVAKLTNTQEDFTNFKFKHYPVHAGEVLGYGKFAVLYPTPGYRLVHRVEPIEIDSLAAVGIFSVKESGKTKPIQKVNPSPQKKASLKIGASNSDKKAVSILPLICKGVKGLLKHEGLSKDKSKDITRVIKEFYGWKNKLEAEGKQIEEDIDEIISEFAESLDIDEDRLNRIYKSIHNLDDCTPAIEYYSGISPTLLYEIDEINEINEIDKVDETKTMNIDELEISKLETINPDKPEGALADILASRFSEFLKYLDKGFWYYDSAKGYWLIYSDTQVDRLIMNTIDEEANNKGDYSSHKISGIRRLLAAKLLTDSLSQEKTNGLLPLKNGVLELKTKQLKPHNPKLGFTYQLAYNYIPDTDCKLIKAWLLEVKGEDPMQVEVLRAFFNAVLKGRVDLQRYLELIGSGGSGKSTCIRLLQALIGLESCYSTNLNELENNRFETAAIIGKKLICINDSDAYGGSVSVLKAITGQDSIRYEVKGKQQGGTGIVSTAMVTITANNPIRSSDYSSGLQRRRLTLNFNNSINPDKMRNLISYVNGEWVGELVPDLPGLLNWILDISDDDVTRLIKDTSRCVPSLALTQKEAIRNSNPLADWLDDKIVAIPGTKTYIGNKKSNENEFLYSNYVAHCENSGTYPISLNNFSKSLEDVCNNQLKLEVVKGNRENKGTPFFGIRLRTDKDISIPTPVTGIVFASDLFIKERDNKELIMTEITFEEVDFETDSEEIEFETQSEVIDLEFDSEVIEFEPFKN